MIQLKCLIFYSFFLLDRNRISNAYSASSSVCLLEETLGKKELHGHDCHILNVLSGKFIKLATNNIELYV